MLTLRCTAKLRQRLRLAAVGAGQPSSTRLGDWYCHLIFFGKVQTILCMSEHTRLPVFLPARDAAGFPARLQEALRLQLDLLGLPRPVIRAEIEAMQPYVFAPTASRSLLGSMNDYKRLAEAYRFQAKPEDLLALSMRLAETPIEMIGWRSPQEATLRALLDPPKPRPATA